MDLIERQMAIEAIAYSIELCNKALDSMTLGGRDRYAVEVERNSLLKLKDDFKLLPSAQPDLNEWCTDCKEYDKEKHCCPRFNRVIREALKDTKPKQYTKEELKAFLHGISLRLLSLRSAQHWQEDDERAKEIEFMAHLYEKVEADMKGKT